MNANKSIVLGVLILAGPAARVWSQGHLHLNAGALSTEPGSQLYFANGDSFVAESGYVFNSVLRTSGPAAGYYDAGLTFTALARDPLNGGPEDGHAGDGAQLALEVLFLEGPQGGSWAFWESLACEDFGDRITFSLAAGETNGTNRFLLSQNNGLPGDDPYGHCHGRRFTMTRPGLYTLGVRIVDLSRNGPGGGPVHTPSPIYRIYFQANTTVAWLTITNDTAAATFATRTGSRYYLEAKSNLVSSSSWQTVAGPQTGDNHLRTLVDPTHVSHGRQYYRLRVTTP